ncbi:hypothetical protein SSYM_2299, partial [Serratia symbiotica str. Tucson]
HLVCVTTEKKHVNSKIFSDIRHNFRTNTTYKKVIFITRKPSIYSISHH